MPFSQATLDFLFENRLQNSQQWFHEHKKEYQQLVVAPLKELVVRLTPVMLEIDPQLTAEPKIDRTISRIWRDTRYSHDKSFYRDNMWIIFRRGKMHGTGMPGLYFKITQSGFDYGCGFYHASPAYMQRLREAILAGAPQARAALSCFFLSSAFKSKANAMPAPITRSSLNSCVSGWSGKTSAFSARAAMEGCFFPSISQRSSLRAIGC
ncbi:MAG: DUF2461 domain-containing protein [Provencibacterium sp.]|jgi:uncharacterized protein (TIGR02453 family)|nr:DUF2461 domain-containing protein [Provencibacterium sp.]